jgi:hypothetical protein
VSNNRVVPEDPVITKTHTVTGFGEAVGGIMMGGVHDNAMPAGLKTYGRIHNQSFRSAYSPRVSLFRKYQDR